MVKVVMRILVHGAGVLEQTARLYNKQRFVKKSLYKTLFYGFLEGNSLLFLSVLLKGEIE